MPDAQPRALRVLLADDHAFIREGLKALIALQDDIEVVGEAEDGAEAIRLSGACRPDIVIMDVSMPVINGAEATKRILEADSSVKVLALSMHEDRAYLHGLLEAGASGYVLKRSAPQELIRALRSVSNGGMYLDPAIAGKVAAPFIERPALRGDAYGMPLSDREDVVIRLVARGLTNREIAGELKLSIKTVETYKTRSMEKLGLVSRAEIIRHAYMRGWLGDK